MSAFTIDDAINALNEYRKSAGGEAELFYLSDKRVLQSVGALSFWEMKGGQFDGEPFVGIIPKHLMGSLDEGVISVIRTPK